MKRLSPLTWGASGTLVALLSLSTFSAAQISSAKPDRVANGPGAPPNPRTRVVNLFVPSTKLQLDGFRVAFLVEEQLHGDLNADGDMDDQVLRVANLATRSQVNTGLAIPPTAEENRSFLLDGSKLLCLVSEAKQGSIDLNGDGDVLDKVLHSFDLVTESAVNLGIAGNVADLTFRDGWGTVLVPEPVQGGTDLDGNGSTIDSVPHVWEAATGTVTNLSVPAFSVATAGGWIVYEASEVNGDLNGDGDLADRILHVHDPALGTTTNFGTATYQPGAFLAPERVGISRNQAIQLVGETEQGAGSLNGDGDALDLVVHVHDLVNKTTTNTGLASGDFTPLAPYFIDERFAAFLVDEAAQGNTNLNGDGDALDDVLHVFDRVSGMTTNSSLQATSLDFDNGQAVVLVREGSQGTSDFNGDGDNNDFGPHVYDTLSNTKVALPYAGQGADLVLGLVANPPRIKSGLVGFAVVEFADGGTDHNGDGDAADRVLFVYDSSTSQVHALAAAIPLLGRSFEVGPSRLAYLVDENAQGGDLTGDGDTQDAVSHFWDRATTSGRNIGFEVLTNDVRSVFQLGNNVACYLLEAGPTLGFLAITFLGQAQAK